MKLRKFGYKIKNIALYGGIEKEEYKRIQMDIHLKNRSSLRVSAGMCAVMFLGLFIGSYFSDALAQAQMFYSVMAFGCGCICALTFGKRTNQNALVLSLWYLLYLMFGSYAVLLNTLIRPELSAVTLCVFLTAGPLIIVDRPIRIASLQLLLFIEYVILAQQMKVSFLAFADSVNLICCIFLGFGVYVRLNRVNLRQALQAQLLQKERDTDSLTGFLNKNAIENEIMNQMSIPNKEGVLVVMDIDNFKSINDNYGHDYGDFVLSQTAKCISRIVPENCLCGRFGGDEFLLFLPDIKRSELIYLLDTMIREMSDAIRLPNPEVTFTTSIGAAPYPLMGKDYQTLFKIADNALYEVKAITKNGWKIAQDTYRRFS